MRQPRLDLPGTFHHVMWRALPGEQLFRDDTDRQRFLQELALVAVEENVRIIARSEMGTHNHMGVQAGENGLSPLMQRLGRRYAGAYNLRHGRFGPVMAGRFTSKLVQREDYLLRLLRYIHRNPVKAGIVTIAELATYPWTGHSAILGNRRASFQETDLVRSWFGSGHSEIRRNLIAFMSDESDDDYALFEHDDIDPEKPRTLIVGSDDFAADALSRAELVDDRREALRRSGVDFNLVASRTAEGFGVAREALLRGSRERRVSLARSVLVYLAVAELGLSRVWLGQRLGVTAGGITRLYQRGQIAAGQYGLDSLPQRLQSELAVVRQ